MKKLFYLIVGTLFTFQLHAQTNISGIINIYTPVSSISSCACPLTNCATVTVTSSAGFAVGNRVIIMQMKGARVDSSNTPTHGSILNLYDAGNYEFATISSITGGLITLSNPLKETYFTNSSPKDSARVQLIRVPIYTGNVNVTGTLSPQAWNGSTGGVLAFEATGTVTLNANITASGLGFNGARRMTASSTCGNDTALYYQSTGWQYTACTSCDYNYDDAVTRPATLASYGGCGGGGPGGVCYTNRMHTNDGRMAGYRGEGVAANTFRKVFANSNVALFEKGRGRWGNGGGGGGNHNGGGGGGGNFGAGGSGGNAYNNTSACPSGTLTNRKGYGGSQLAPTATKIFMGGGGGEGHDNGGNGSTGTAGGGIILIKATSISNGGAYTITANGADNTFVAFGDGSGGGGAGGSIILNVSGGYTNSISISAKGGKGGDHNNNNCHGTGGGGGGGVIWFAGGSTSPANVTSNITGGANGVQVAGSIDCGDVNWGATSGGNGILKAGPEGGASDLFNFQNCSSPLPVHLTWFDGYVNENEIVLAWNTASELNNKVFEIERSADFVEFTRIGSVNGAGTSTTSKKYKFDDLQPINGTNYYRLKQIDFDGTFIFSKIIAISYVDHSKEIKVYPNPAMDFFIINFPWEKEFDVAISDFNGNILLKINKQQNKQKINCADIPKGLYLLRITTDRNSYTQKLMLK